MCASRAGSLVVVSMALVSLRCSLWWWVRGPGWSVGRDDDGRAQSVHARRHVGADYETPTLVRYWAARALALALMLAALTAMARLTPTTVVTLTQPTVQLSVSRA